MAIIFSTKFNLNINTVLLLMVLICEFFISYFAKKLSQIQGVYNHFSNRLLKD
jgi:hypothetical protein